MDIKRKFRTEFVSRKSSVTLDPRQPVALVGSCFADNIAAKMRDVLWEGVNPLGALYNPLSISTALRLMLFSLFPERDFEKTLFLHEGKYHSRLFGSGFSAWSAVDCMAAFREKRLALSSTLAKGNVLIVTFGTAYAYFLKDAEVIPVGNCHKCPSSDFTRRRLGIDEIEEDWQSLLNELKKRLPELKVIFTVSPVRHLKDGFSENTRSKAVLQLAVENLCNANDFCTYFPAYEILNDDLRDYRFYASDMVHPSEEAVDYIWDNFLAVFLDDQGKCRIKEGDRLGRALRHRPIPDASVLIPDEVRKVQDERDALLQKELENFNDNNFKI